ncbi:MAG: M12 family metallo-peptidase [Gammaproteobacteria bacterium]|nr:M12 family metallo-peptidase [Gammaproteobacteria bacterium]
MDVHIKKHLTLLALLLLPHTSMAQPLWTDISVVKNTVNSSTVSVQAKALPNPHVNARRVSVDYAQLKSTLAAAHVADNGVAQKQLSPPQIELPMPYGGLQTFNVLESSIIDAELAAKYPQIKTYKVVAVSDPTVTGVLDTGDKGFHAYLNTTDGDVFIDPVAVSTQQEYYSYYKRDYVSTAPREFSCGLKQKSIAQSPVAEFQNKAFVTAARTTDTDFISYRLAVATTGEFSNSPDIKQPSSTTTAQIKADALSVIVTQVARINLIVERDLAIRFILVANNDQIIFTDAANDPYTDPTDGSLMLEENQATLDDNNFMGAANYDIGHVLGLEGGGLAILGAACFEGYKGQGESGHPYPVGDPFYIDIVAHELGHQLGANHSFNGTTASCGSGNRNAATAYEPGSGTTIMAYSGICGAENTAGLGDATFHAGSIAEILDYTRNSDGNTCSTPEAGSVAPVVDAGPDYTIPGGTAFTLTGSATDTEVLNYQWDQMDVGKATNSSTFGTDLGSNPLFRSFEPLTSAERTLPQRLTLFGINPDNYAVKAETLPIENRTLNFRLTARDNSGGVGEDDMQVTVNGKAGPFKILQPNTNVILNSGLPQSIQWNAACTNAAPVNCANVDILLTKDNGQSYTTLLASTPNSGIASVTLPAGNTSSARIKIACPDNIFFDISDVDFEINSAGGSLPTALIGGSYDCGTATIPAPSSGGGGGVINYHWLLMLLITPLLRCSRSKMSVKGYRPT